MKTIMRVLAIGVVLVTGLVVFTQNWTQTGQTNLTRVGPTHAFSDRFWQAWYVNASEVERFQSMEDMAGSVDVVVEGRLSSTQPGRTFEDKGRTIAWYASVTLDVTRMFRGVASNTLEFEVFFSQEGRYEKFLETPLSQERAILFLRNKAAAAIATGWSEADAAAEAPYNMLVNQGQSYFRDLPNGVHVPAPGSGDFTDDWEGRSFAELEATVANLTGP